MGRDSIILTGGLVIVAIVVITVIVCYLMIKKQKQTNASYNQASAEERALLEGTSYRYSQTVRMREFVAMRTGFPHIVSEENKVYPSDVIITKNWLNMGHTVRKTYVKNAAFRFVSRRIVYDAVSRTEASVSKRAAVGAVLGGAAGALVGAASAIETNKKGGVEHHSLTDTDLFSISLQAILPAAAGTEKQYVPCRCLLLSDALMENLKNSPEVMACVEKINGNYIKLSDQPQEQSETLVAWLNKNVLALS